MRIPYVVGRWVRGDNYYGRQRLLKHLLSASDSALWVVGTRRMGKTSLLRQLELLTEQPDGLYLPLFWDLQGCENSEDLSNELRYAVEDAAERFTPYDVVPADLEGQDAVGILRVLNRALAAHGKTLLLLIDEAEALLRTARREPDWLAKLRKALQSERQRTVMTSTKLLSHLNDLTSGWTTSPFLFGFSLVNLWSLDYDSAVALVRQAQADASVEVGDALVQEILVHTNRHPYLIQYLCQRLFVAGDSGRGRLRPIVEEDLVPDQLLAGFCQIDFQHLSRTEQRILLHVAQAGVVSEDALAAALSSEPPGRLRTFLYGLNKLGYVRRLAGRWTVGNEYLRRWLYDNMEHLLTLSESALDDASIEELLQQGFSTELAYLHRDIAALQTQIDDLRRRQVNAPAGLARALEREIARVAASLDQARRELAEILPHQVV